MSSLIRWTPGRAVSTLSDMVDRMFDEMFPAMRSTFGPNVDVIENDDNFVVKAELPGFKPEEVDVRFENGYLTMSGKTGGESERDEGRYHVRERRMSSFSRTIGLPGSVNADKATAEFENGVLTLTLPKNEAARPKHITIHTKK